MHVRPMNLGGGAVTCLPAPGYNLDVWYDDCYAINGSLPTRCVEVLTGGKAPERWAGNVIAVRTERPLAYCIRYYNANMQEDLPRLLDFFGRYGTSAYTYDTDASHKWGGRMQELEY